MSDIYVFGPKEDDNDYSTMGLVGALSPTSCKFEETGNGESLLTIDHPKDEYGKYNALAKGNIIVAPVPVRTTPEIQNGSCVTTVWTYKVKPLDQLTSKNQRTLYKASKGSGKMKIMNAGDVVTVVQKPDEQTEITRWKVKSNYGTGWIDPNGFELVTEHTISNKADAIEEIQSPWKITPQYFRIYEVKKSLDNISVSARHISYDLLYDICHYRVGAENANTCQQTLDMILACGYGENDRFKAYTNVENTKAGLSFRGKTIIDCLLDPEEGVCAQYDVSLIRDNYDLYFLHEPGINRGVKLIYGKNMTGIDFTSSDDEVATRLVPIGETKDGYELGLGQYVVDQYVDSPLINNYPIKHVYWFTVDNCKVGEKDENGSTVTEAIARARMRAAAEKLIEDGCDKPKIEMSVEFVNLGDTEEYAQFKDLENAFLFDYVLVQHPDFDIDVTAQIVKITWDCLLDRMESVEIGTVGETLANSGITSWQIPSGFSGSKIGTGTLGNKAFKDDIIAARHVQADSINTDALQAECVTALKIAAGAITAEKLDATTVDAKIANVVIANLTTANIQNAKIDWADIKTLNAAIAEISKAHIKDTDIDWANIENLTAAIGKITTAEIAKATITTAQIKNLDAAIAKVVKLTVATGNFDLADIKNLLANALILQQGIADSMMITNLAVTSANLLNATIDKLVLKGADGKYYRVFIGSDGTIQTEEVTVTDGEVAAGETEEGRQIVATTANISDLNATTIKASEAIIGTIFTESLTAGKITANDALIASLTAPIIYTTAIQALGDSLDLSANESIKLTVQGVRDDIDEVSNATETALGLAETAQDTANNARTEAANAQAAADEANEAAATIQTQLELTKDGLAIVQNETIPGLDGRVKTLESGVHISGAEIGIYTSESPYRNTITNSGWTISENGTAIIECAETKLTAPRVQVTDAFIVGGLAWKPGSDKHVRMLKYGR